jgi:hypothetical protein
VLIFWFWIHSFSGSSLVQSGPAQSILLRGARVARFSCLLPKVFSRSNRAAARSWLSCKRAAAPCFLFVGHVFSRSAAGLRRPAPKLLRRRAPVRVSTFPASTPPGADFGFDSTCGSGSSFSFLRTFDSPGQVRPVDLILL